jgi:4-oxalocrotonate tautomerase
MPVISVKFIEGFFSEEQKKQMIPKLTDAFVACTMEGTRPYIYVLVEEVKPGQWGLGGTPLPDWEFMINGFPKVVERATSEMAQIYGVTKTTHLAAPEPGGVAPDKT